MENDRHSKKVKIRFRKKSNRFSVISVNTNLTSVSSSQQNLNVVPYRRQRGRVQSFSWPSSMLFPKVYY